MDVLRKEIQMHEELCRKKDKQTIKETQEHMWLFNGMAGFKKNRK